MREGLKNTMTTKVLGPTRGGVSGAWKKLHNEELHNFVSPPSIFLVIQSREIRQAEHEAHMGERRGAYRILVGKLEGKRLLPRPRRRWKSNNKLGPQKMGWEDADWIYLA